MSMDEALEAEGMAQSVNTATEDTAAHAAGRTVTTHLQRLG